MKKILILHFGCLNNYGTGMMGLVTVNELHKRYKGDVEFHCDFNEFSTLLLSIASVSPSERLSEWPTMIY